MLSGLFGIGNDTYDGLKKARKDGNERGTASVEDVVGNAIQAGNVDINTISKFDLIDLVVKLHETLEQKNKEVETVFEREKRLALVVKRVRTLARTLDEEKRELEEENKELLKETKELKSDNEKRKKQTRTLKKKVTDLENKLSRKEKRIAEVERLKRDAEKQSEKLEGYLREKMKSDYDADDQFSEV